MAPKNPVISVIIPTYFEEQNIQRCLQSIQQQTFEKARIETIVVDSHSLDNTRTIAEKHADKVLDLNERGVSKARNIGARKAEGDILLFVDADTALDSHFVAEINEAFADSRVVCVIGSMASLENFGTVNNLFSSIHYRLVNAASKLTARIGFPLFPTVCCACRKSAFQTVGGFDEGLAIAEDLTFSLKMRRIGKCRVSKKARAYTSVRRIRKNGFIKNYYVYFKNYFKVFVLKKKPWIGDFPHTTET